MVGQQADGNDACAYPPELDDVELIAAADGEASAKTYAHLGACPGCAARAEAVTELQSQLRERLYRLFCPTSDELATFAQGLMVADMRDVVADHVISCPHCLGELNMLAAITATPPHRSPALPLRRVVAYPGSPDVSLSTSPALNDPIVYHAGALRIVLSVERQRGAAGTRLRGVLRGNRPQVVTASLLCNNRVISSSLLDGQGGFILDDVPAGDVVLSLRLADYEVVVEALRLL